MLPWQANQTELLLPVWDSISSVQEAQQNVLACFVAMSADGCKPTAKAVGHYGPLPKACADLAADASHHRGLGLDWLVALHWPRLEPPKERLRIVLDALGAVPDAQSAEQAWRLLTTAEATLDVVLIGLGLPTLPSICLHPKCGHNGTATAFAAAVRELRAAVDKLDHAVNTCVRGLLCL